MNLHAIPAALFGTALLTAGCAVRQPDMYRDDTAKVLTATIDPAIKGCYERVLAKTPGAGGIVHATFLINGGNGSFTDATVVASQSTAPPAVQQCVTTALSSGSLSPADQQTAQGNVTYVFTP